MILTAEKESGGVTSVKVTDEGYLMTSSSSGTGSGSGTGNILNTIYWDAWSRVETSTTVDTITYFTGGLTGTTVATRVITYKDATQAKVMSDVTTTPA